MSLDVSDAVVQPMASLGWAGESEMVTGVVVAARIDVRTVAAHVCEKPHVVVPEVGMRPCMRLHRRCSDFVTCPRSRPRLQQRRAEVVQIVIWASWLPPSSALRFLSSELSRPFSLQPSHASSLGSLSWVQIVLASMDWVAAAWRKDQSQCRIGWHWMMRTGSRLLVC